MMILLAGIGGQVSAQEPAFPVKDISGTQQYDGTKLPVAAGWEMVASTGTGSVANGELFLSGNTNQQYSFRATATTSTPFIVTGDYTIELRIKVPASTGRGFDMVLRDQVGRLSISIGPTKIINQTTNVTLKALDGTEYHTYRFACKRADKKMYLYVDGDYVTSTDFTANVNGPDLQFGKGENASSASIYLDYIAFDNTGAYKAVKTYSVDFESNGGAAVFPLSVAENGLVVKPTDPVRVSFGFAGWYKDAALSTVWNFGSDRVNANTTLYARWDSQLYNISFNSNGGTTVAEIRSGYYNSKILPPAEPSKTGFGFGGWYKEAGLVNIWNFDTDVITGHQILNAKWNDRNQTITVPAVADKVYGVEPFPLNAVSSSGLPVKAEVVSGNVSVDGNNISVIGTGRATIRLSQAGDSFYLPAAPVEFSFNISKSTQEITFPSIGRINRFAGSVPTGASSTSGVPLQYKSSDPLVADIIGDNLIIKGLGTATITAYHDGDNNYLPARPVSIIISVFTNARYSKVLFKSAVSPNGDGMNDVFIIEGIGDFPENSVKIMNSNGTLVYHQKGYNNQVVAFDGRGSNGERLPGGTYYYAVDLKIGDAWQQKKGYLVLRY